LEGGREREREGERERERDGEKDSRAGVGLNDQAEETKGSVRRCDSIA
jgi:hypothetical protein